MEQDLEEQVVSLQIHFFKIVVTIFIVLSFYHVSLAAVKVRFKYCLGVLIIKL